MTIIQFEPPNTVNLPAIQLQPGEIARAVDETQDVLMRAGKPVFQRHWRVVQPIYTEFNASHNRKTRVTAIRFMTIGMLRYLLTKRVVRFLQYDGRSRMLRQIDPPDKVLSTLLDVGHWKFEQIVGVFNSPTMRPDGSIIHQKGFDKTTQLWLDWEDDIALPFELINGEPTKEDAAVALKMLQDLLVGFPFVESVDKSVALAAMMTAVLRGGFEFTPMFLFVAHTSGDGKSYMADLISTVASGKLCPVIGTVNSEEEVDKQLSTMLLQSPSIISLDNLMEDVKSPLLCQICTQSIIQVRILGKSEMPECMWRGTVLGTGNNIQFSGDMLRRGLTSRINSKMENPEKRIFDFKPIKCVLENRSKYLAAIFTIARAYNLSKEKISCSPYGGFEGWNAFVRAPLLWLGCDDPLKSIDWARANDTGLLATKIIMCWWAKNIGSRPITARQLTEAAREVDMSNFDGSGAKAPLKHPDLHDALLVEAPRKNNQLEVRSIGRWLTRNVGAVHVLISENGESCNYSIEIAEKNDNHGHKFKLLMR